MGASEMVFTDINEWLLVKEKITTPEVNYNINNGEFPSKLGGKWYKIMAESDISKY